MADKVLPRYPVYLPSKGRQGAAALTARCLDRDGVPFRLVVEPQEAKAYADQFGVARVLTLPFSNLGQGSIPARNWIKDHATAEGHARHWQLDDNIRTFYRRFRGKRLYCAAGLALRVGEDFADRYENVALLGLNYAMFLPDGESYPPFYLNSKVYSCTLALNALPHRWRGRYNEDTDLCLQVLADGWCTVVVNAFCCQKMATMRMKGGNLDSLYQGDGRLRMARALERMWPGVVETKRRFKRPQHVVHDAWGKFDTPLRLKEGVTLVDAPADEYGMTLVERKPLRSPHLRALVGDLLSGGAVEDLDGAAVDVGPEVGEAPAV